MSRARKRDNYSPSLFPFLAVLLCTMGSLVLLLMLIVSQAQASAKQMAVDKKQRVEEVEAQLELARDSFERELSDRRLDLERKRLALQHLEKHIQELLAEMEDIAQTAKLLADKTVDEQTSEAETQRKISELEAQLAKATEELKQKIDKPEGDKPIFAIIPYQGTNGTHRRPIYLECVEKGVMIQPEGILIGLSDLRPPYGPGNPLDAALRTIRSRYAPANGALTSTAYPLLVVRPSGIRTYAMARQAMSGWDDQFGYELIDEELELAYPESQSGLTADIQKALTLARERQAALILAMPQKYRQFINSGGGGDQFEFAEDEGGFGDEWVRGSSGTGKPGSSSRNGTQAGSSLQNAGGSRGGFAAGGEYAVGGEYAGGAGADRMSGNAVGIGASTAGSALNDPSGDNSQAGDLGSDGATYSSSGDSFFSNGSSRSSANSGDSMADASRSSSGGSYGSGDVSEDPGGNATQGNDASSSNPTAAGTARAGLRANSGSIASSGSSASNSGSTSGPGGSASAPGGDGQPSAQSPPPDASLDPAMQNLSPSMNMDLSTKQTQKSTPVAQTRGRNWAWADGPPTKTAVIRSIRIVCYTDRWVVMPDNGSSANQVTIPIGDVPQASAEKLAKVVTERVSGWGIALSGGYWKPELSVDVAPDAEARYQQLLRLLEGSGLVVQRRSAAN